ncbi:MAG: tRNA lysidine(34) synthetase TilS [Rhodobacteraceae bacterium]|nr:tRNA lysidine(34) synthetase TilS [Paracoccaceae bacterium]
MSLNGAAAEAGLAPALLAALPAGARVGIAVSGGGDSRALLQILAETAPAAGWTLGAATVDHGLRPAAAAEARAVAAACAGLGIAHATLPWTDRPAGGNLMEAARTARRRLLAGWAAGAGLTHVALAHTADDQAETLLMGLARAAGIDGLAGMRPCWEEGGLVWVRPWLGLGRATLRAALLRRGIGWIEDPTNADDRFARARARQALAALAPLGLTVAGLARAAANLACARAALDAAAAAAAGAVVREVAGALRLDRAGLRALPGEVQRRLIVAALRWVAGFDHAPRGPATTRFLAAALAGRGATLAGVRLLAAGEALILVREPKAVAGRSVPTGAAWDGRWRLSGPHRAGLATAALGPRGLALCPDWRAGGVPGAVLAVTPAVWEGAHLVAAPLAGRPEGWRVAPLAPFAAALSH